MSATSGPSPEFVAEHDRIMRHARRLGRKFTAEDLDAELTEIASGYIAKVDPDRPGVKEFYADLKRQQAGGRPLTGNQLAAVLNLRVGWKKKYKRYRRAW